MRGIKLDFSKFGYQFLEQAVGDVERIFEESGLCNKGDIRFSTFIKVVREELEKRDNEED